MKKNQLTLIVGLLLLLGVFGCGRSGSSTTTVTGVLTINGSPASEKIVYLKNAIGGSSKPMMTDAQGRFTYNNVVPGNYQTYYLNINPTGTFYSGGHEMVFQAVMLTKSNRMDIAAQMDIPEPPDN